MSEEQEKQQPNLQDLESEVVKVARGAVQKAIVDGLTSYQSPLTKAVGVAFARHDAAFAVMVEEELVGLMSDPKLREDIREALRQKLAKSLVSKAGGELEKRVNELRQNPETRAKITLALSKMVDEIGNGTD